MYTLPILAHDPLSTYGANKRVGIRKVLEESGVEWASLEFWYRGTVSTRAECVATVLIGAKDAEGEKWWGKEGVVERVREKVKGRMVVEICWREKREW